MKLSAPICWGIQSAFNLQLFIVLILPLLLLYEISCPMDLTSLDVRLFSVPVVNSFLSKVPLKIHWWWRPVAEWTLRMRIIAATFFTFSSVVLRLNWFGSMDVSYRRSILVSFFLKKSLLWNGSEVELSVRSYWSLE